MILRRLDIKLLLTLTLTSVLPWDTTRSAETDASFALSDGDRVVFLGDALFERASRYGHIETLFTLAYANQNIKFRNLGWSGDTVEARSRDYFDKPGDGYVRLLAHVKRLNPTWMFIAYGSNESYAGTIGLDSFRTHYERLLDDLSTQHPLLRFVLFSPFRHETSKSPNPNSHEQNAIRRTYGEAIADIAREHDCFFVDLQAAIPEDVQLTYNGVHLTGQGYATLADAIARELGVPCHSTADSPAVRRLVIQKNRLYFYRWRPQNETYLFGHRKHEQGNNAIEISEFDPLVNAKEQAIRTCVLKSK